MAQRSKRVSPQDDRVLKAARAAGMFYARIIRMSEGDFPHAVVAVAAACETGFTHVFLPKLGTWEWVGV